jgi:hypothetical protein
MADIVVCGGSVIGLAAYRKILQEQLPDVFDGLVASGGTWVDFLAALPQEVFARPGLWHKVEAATPDEPFAMPGPTREELLALLA